MTTPDLEKLLALLSVEERVLLLTGATTWSLQEMPAIGLRAVTVSDGPIGVRGGTGPRHFSAQLPAPSAVAATWDEELIAGLGTIMAAEARAKGIDVILAPVVNLQRTPVAGRHFECFSEDPLLTTRVAGAFVAAVQDAGVGACVKHFVGNESETERTTYLARISPRVLREVYFQPFEHIVRNVGVWMVMTAYNGLDDGVEAAPTTEHTRLLDDVLKTEWGFDGVVVSDWLATKTTIPSARAGLDLVMPGPGGPWAEGLLDAVRAGEVSQQTIDNKVRRLLRLADRVGALDGSEQSPAGPSGDSPETVAALRTAAARATVVLRNEELLPLPQGVTSIALIGANALDPFAQGGGSAFVTAPHLSLPADEIARAFPSATVTTHRGGATLRHLPFATDVVGDVITIDLLDANGNVVQRREEPAPMLDGRINDLPDEAVTARVTVALRLDAPGEHLVEVAAVGRHHIVLDGETLSRTEGIVGAEVVLDSSSNHPDAALARVSVDRPREVPLVIDTQIVTPGSYPRFAHVEIRHRVPGPTVRQEIDEAVAAARKADVAVVVVGTNPETESEGWDRPDLALPASQSELVRAVAAANPRTVVVVNAGSPVILPWLDEVPAVLWWWLPGQEAGGSLADVLTGATEPAGRLPWTLPASEADVPVPHGIPVDGVIDYTEGVDVGHRAWDRLGRTPAREFGYGLGYGQWRYGEPAVAPASGDGRVRITVPLTNVGERRAREVVQVYLEAPHDEERPVRWLAGFSAVEVEPGAEVTVSVDVLRRAFEIWDVEAGDWRLPACDYRVVVGRSSRDVRGVAKLAMPLERR